MPGGHRHRSSPGLPDGRLLRRSVRDQRIRNHRRLSRRTAAAHAIRDLGRAAARAGGRRDRHRGRAFAGQENGRGTLWRSERLSRCARFSAIGALRSPRDHAETGSHAHVDSDAGRGQTLDGLGARGRLSAPLSRGSTGSASRLRERSACAAQRFYIDEKNVRRRPRPRGGRRADLGLGQERIRLRRGRRRLQSDGNPLGASNTGAAASADIDYSGNHARQFDRPVDDRCAQNVGNDCRRDQAAGSAVLAGLEVSRRSDGAYQTRRFRAGRDPATYSHRRHHLLGVNDHISCIREGAFNSRRLESMQISRRRPLLMFLLVLLWSLFDSASMGQAETVKFVLPGNSMGYLPLFVAVHRGFFKDEGIDIELPRLLPSLAHNALIAGEAQYHGLADSGLRLAARGMPLKAIFYAADRPMYYLVAQKEFRSVAELKGKRIGVSQFGGTSDLAARLALRHYGVEPEKDAVLIQIGAEGIRMAALRAGSVGAIIVTFSDVAALNK